MIEGAYDYRRFAVLYVDDEEKSLTAFSRALGDQFRILTARDAREGYELLVAHRDEIGILITDQRMPGEKGVQLLEKARQLNPKMLRILATAYSDIDAAVDAVNTGAIYKYLSKPWDPAQLDMTLKRALEFFIVQRERDQLLREKLSVLQHLMITDRVVSLGIAASGIGHYVRNSLVAVRTFLDLAPAKLQDENVNLDDLRNPNFWREFYQSVQGQVTRITQLLTQLEMAARVGPSAFPDKVDLRALIEAACVRGQTRMEAAGLRISNMVPVGLPLLTGDAAALARLLDLMLEDELISLKRGSSISIRARRGRQGSADESVVIELEDDGAGVPVEALRSLFDPFFVRNGDPQAFGINLMACYFIVYHHGGTMRVNAAGAKGALFTIELPVVPPVGGARQTEEDFLAKVMMNDALWERLLSTA